MVEKDRHCIDILERVSAATRALQSVASQPLDAHMADRLVAAGNKAGDEVATKLEEASAAVAPLVRS
jgi:DNA-binding FrmR family transcriptional regulator